MTWFNRFCVIVDLSQVLSLRSTLKERSAEHELTGEVRHSRSNLSTCGNMVRTSGTMLLKQRRKSSTVLPLNFEWKNVIVCLFAWGLTALLAQIVYIAP